jgi:hypothetical protein
MGGKFEPLAEFKLAEFKLLAAQIGRAGPA